MSDRDGDGSGDASETPDGTGDLTFRRVPADLHAEYQRHIDYAFHPEDGPTAYRDGPDDGPPDDLPERQGERWGVFAGDDLRSICTRYEFEARLRGDWVPLAGLAAVATPPEHRREGYVSHLVAECLERWRGDLPLAALWPFDHPYYRQFGWATACERAIYECPPEALAFARDAADDHSLRRVEADEWERLVDAHLAHAADRTLTLRRDEEWWRERVFDSLGGQRPYVYAVERDGSVRGYVAYSMTDTGDGFTDRHIRVGDLAFADEAAHRALLGFLADHDSQAEQVHIVRDADAALLDRVADPFDVDCEIRQGPMVRVVDVVHALEACPYPDGASEDLTLAVADDTAPWNDGAFRLSVDDGEAECVRLDRSADESDESDVADEANAALSVETLSQLVVGYHSVADARRVADLRADDDAAAALAALFPPETVHLRTYF